jgi:hypothetical protein
MTITNNSANDEILIRSTLEKSTSVNDQDNYQSDINSDAHGNKLTSLNDDIEFPPELLQDSYNLQRPFEDDFDFQRAAFPNEPPVKRSNSLQIPGIAILGDASPSASEGSSSDSNLDKATRMKNAVDDLESAKSLLADRRYSLDDAELITLLWIHKEKIMAEAELQATKILDGYLSLSASTLESISLTTEELFNLTTTVVTLYNIFVFSGNRLDFAALSKTEAVKSSPFAAMFDDINKYNKNIPWLLPMLVQYISKNVITEMDFLYFVLHENNRAFPLIDGNNVTQNENFKTIPFIDAFVKYVLYIQLKNTLLAIFNLEDSAVKKAQAIDDLLRQYITDSDNESETNSDNNTTTDSNNNSDDASTNLFSKVVHASDFKKLISNIAYENFDAAKIILPMAKYYQLDYLEKIDILAKHQDELFEQVEQEINNLQIPNLSSEQIQEISVPVDMMEKIFFSVFSLYKIYDIYGDEIDLNTLLHYKTETPSPVNSPENFSNECQAMLNIITEVHRNDPWFVALVFEYIASYLDADTNVVDDVFNNNPPEWDTEYYPIMDNTGKLFPLLEVAFFYETDPVLEILSNQDATPLAKAQELNQLHENYNEQFLTLFFALYNIQIADSYLLEQWQTFLFNKFPEALHDFPATEEFYEQIRQQYHDNEEAIDAAFDDFKKEVHNGRRLSSIDLLPEIDDLLNYYRNIFTNLVLRLPHIKYQIIKLAKEDINASQLILAKQQHYHISDLERDSITAVNTGIYFKQRALRQHIENDDEDSIENSPPSAEKTARGTLKFYYGKMRSIAKEYGGLNFVKEIDALVQSSAGYFYHDRNDGANGDTCLLFQHLIEKKQSVKKRLINMATKNIKAAKIVLSKAIYYNLTDEEINKILSSHIDTIRKAAVSKARIHYSTMLAGFEVLFPDEKEKLPTFKQIIHAVTVLQEVYDFAGTLDTLTMNDFKLCGKELNILASIPWLTALAAEYIIDDKNITSIPTICNDKDWSWFGSEYPTRNSNGTLLPFLNVLTDYLKDPISNILSAQKPLLEKIKRLNELFNGIDEKNKDFSDLTAKIKKIKPRIISEIGRQNFKVAELMLMNNKYYSLTMKEIITLLKICVKNTYEKADDKAGDLLSDHFSFPREQQAKIKSYNDLREILREIVIVRSLEELLGKPLINNDANVKEFESVSAWFEKTYGVMINRANELKATDSSLFALIEEYLSAPAGELPSFTKALYETTRPKDVPLFTTAARSEGSASQATVASQTGLHKTRPTHQQPHEMVLARQATAKSSCMIL